MRVRDNPCIRVEDVERSGIFRACAEDEIDAKRRGTARKDNSARHSVPQWTKYREKGMSM